MTAKMKILIKAIENKLSRGEQLDVILKSYVKLNDKEKEEIIKYFKK